MQDAQLLPFSFDSTKFSSKENTSQPKEDHSLDTVSGTQVHRRMSSIDAQGFRIPLSPVKTNYKRRANDYIRRQQLEDDDSKKLKRSLDATKLFFGESSSSSFQLPSSEHPFPLEHSGRIPSSPPMPSVAQSSDDFEDSTFIMPSSPPQFMATQETEIADDIPKRVLLNPSSDSLAPLDLDEFGRVHATRQESKLDSEFDTEMEVDQKDVERRLREEINKMFENQENKLNFENYGLEVIPSEIGDLNNLTIFSGFQIAPAKIEIFMSGNNITTLSPSLFDVKGITVLSLRYNKIRRVPGAIERLTNLKYLSVANNRIAYFPHNILKLSCIETLTIRPNPLIEPDAKIATSVNVDIPFDEAPTKVLKYFGRIRWLADTSTVCAKATAGGLSAQKLMRNFSTFSRQTTNFNTMLGEDGLDEMFPQSQPDVCDVQAETVSYVPRLTELTLREISKYKISASELKKWKTHIPPRLKKLAFDALINGSNGETCGWCEENIVDAVAEVMEWWDVNQIQNLPIQRKFCSGKCTIQWQDSINVRQAGLSD
ncbi:unnamed protein product [Kuraishia capsulata CBS 1993]|uniref:Uncharacterized protein n=1 Tax=Kuraishia capsulata CBS 1993 TaxID=1382522 RepID=W6MIF4_9ASCO|nr:uncharacterized protein KUCA_T00001643001 [Kuraishia capsulata CBS 1993]CDK25673.1 unnamed protein product [Kuraishia capsulata CBS 1993]